MQFSPQDVANYALDARSF